MGRDTPSTRGGGSESIDIVYQPIPCFTRYICPLPVPPLRASIIVTSSTTLAPILTSGKGGGKHPPFTTRYLCDLRTYPTRLLIPGMGRCHVPLPHCTFPGTGMSPTRGWGVQLHWHCQTTCTFPTSVRKCPHPAPSGEGAPPRHAPTPCHTFLSSDPPYTRGWGFRVP